MQVSIGRPYLLVLIPLIIIGVILSSRWLFQKKDKKRNVLIIRSVLIFLIVLALCGINFRWDTKGTTNLFIVDLSSSASNYRGEADRFISEAINTIPIGETAGVLVFGENVLVDRFINESRAYNQITTTPIQRSTNIQNALTSALALFPEDRAKRIILISDGEENEGDTRRIIPSLMEQNVEINVLKIDHQEQQEVYIDDLRVPDRIHYGETFNIVVEVKSNVETQGQITLYSGRTKKGVSTVDIQKGDNRFVFQDTQLETGIQTYKAVIEPLIDTELRNNEYTTYTNVQTQPKLLLVEGEPGEGEVLEEILKASNIEYVKRSPFAVPRTLNELTEYKSIILANVNANDLSDSFLSNIKPYVNDYAGGLIVTGGENAFALGDYKDTPLEEVLPVYMDLKGKKEIPEMAIVMIIDQSGSMSDGNGFINNLDMAKEAAIEALNTIRDTDSIGILAFDHTYQWIVDIQQANNKDAINRKINSIDIQGGTSIFPALKEGYEQINKTNAQIKHIILLTDGQDGFVAYDDLLEEMNNNNITLSTVSIGFGADTFLLNRLSNMGNGRYYHTDLNTDIPRIFAQEVYLSSRQYLHNRAFFPRIRYNHPILNRVVTNRGLPSLLGYIASSPKENATVILDSDEEDPILAVWQYGLGRTVAWNSDISGAWSAQYTPWENNITLWQNIINWTLENYESSSSNATVSIEGNKAKISYVSEHIDPNIRVSAVSTSEEGQQKEIQLSNIKPGEYEGMINLDDIGYYSMNIRETLNDNVIGYVNTAAVMQYPLEYKFFENKQVLEMLVNETNGRFIENPQEIFEGNVQAVKAMIDITNFLLVLALLLFVYDIGNRRLNIDIRKYFGSKKKLNQESIKDETINDGNSETIKVEEKEKNITKKKSLKTKEKVKKVKKEENKNQAVSTTSALLQKKKDRL
ncbi:von Willebrand factor type A domain-containing protein [Natranaerovirga pectinivora]|uniref:von Willebrand factor type A domain-containing protein n=2 Tax=Natranaerovirga pectinivora TaxID=682400 RepID=A0A4R3MND9_9FIRM|nr:von Willebrand factor type A domain-containing protein [Natranaerovirga pectinivora]